MTEAVNEAADNTLVFLRYTSEASLCQTTFRNREVPCSVDKKALLKRISRAFYLGYPFLTFMNRLSTYREISSGRNI